ncbi:MAG: hypothetical protein Q4C04_04500 [Clostridia bacterium]|nr:hypothetical protein [Clostridia bacterium]
MKLTSEMIEKVKEALRTNIENALDGKKSYDRIGVRIQSVPFELGEISHNSHVWFDGDDTGDELDGISTIAAEQIERINAGYGEYYGEYAAIIGGDLAEYGEDDGEIVLRNAEVIEVLA